MVGGLECVLLGDLEGRGQVSQLVQMEGQSHFRAVVEKAQRTLPAREDELRGSHHLIKFI